MRAIGAVVVAAMLVGCSSDPQAPPPACQVEGTYFASMVRYEDGGNHQFQRPRSDIEAGSSRPRTIVTSSRTATAMPTPISFMATRSPSAKPANTWTNSSVKGQRNDCRMA